MSMRGQNSRAAPRFGQEVGQVQASMEQAGDAQIARIVAMVDAMPERGAADALIAPLRPRLAQLRLPRRYNFTRLLFMPLDSLIVPLRGWRRGDMGIPRTTLAPLGAALRAELPDLASEIDRALAAGPHGERSALVALGSRLWSAAAEVLDEIAMPDGWAEAADLMFNDYPDIARTISGVLHEATAIDRLTTGRRTPSDEAIGAVLSRSQARGSIAIAAVVTILLGRLPAPDRVMILAAEINRGNPRAGSDRVAEHALRGLANAVENGVANASDITRVAVEATRVALMLEALDDGKAVRPERRRRIEQIRRDTDAVCKRRFGEAVETTLARQQTAIAAPNDSDGIYALEASARDLRRLEAAGRLLGSPEFYDGLLRKVSTSFSTPSALALADRMRLVEILSGPDEALAIRA